MQSLKQQYSASQIDQLLERQTEPVKDLAKKDLARLWIITLLGSGLILLLIFGKIQSRLFLYGLGALMLFDLIPLDRQFIHSTSDGYRIPAEKTDVITFLKKDPDKFRILPFPPAVDNEANKWCLHDIESAAGYNAVGLKIYDDVRNSRLMSDLKFLGLFNVKYLVTRQPYQDPNLELVFQERSKCVFRNRLFLPRVFFVKNHQVITNAASHLTAMSSPAFDPEKTVLLFEKPEWTGKNRQSSGTNSIEILEFNNDKIRLTTRSEHPLFLVNSDIFYPKWECFVDGNERKIYRADYLLRAVPLEAGSHEVVFKYKNNGSYLLMMLVTRALTLGLIVFMIIKRKKWPLLITEEKDNSKK